MDGANQHFGFKVNDQQTKSIRQIFRRNLMKLRERERERERERRLQQLIYLKIYETK